MNLTLLKNWKTSDLSEVIDLIIDHRGLTPLKLGGNWVESGYRALSAKNVKTGQIIQDGPIRFIDESLYKRWMPVEIERGDILLTSEGPLGEYFLWDSDEKIVLSQRLFGIRTNKKILDPKFFYYLLGTPFYKGELFGRATGTTVEGIKQSELLKTKVIFPESLDDQREIAAILGSLDDKIELLRRESKTLESIAQALFREWFVEFRFPGYEEVKVVGGVPEGWKTYELRDIFQFVKGKKPLELSDLPKEGFLPQILIENLDGGKNIYAKNEKVVVCDNTNLLMVMDGASSGRIEFGHSGIVGSTLSKLEFKIKARAITYFFLKSTEKNIRENTTGSAIPHTDKEKVYLFTIALPSNLEVMENTFSGFMDKMILSRKEIQSLSKLRDDLLNKIFNI